MRKIRLNQANLSEIIWQQMFDFSYHEYVGNHGLHKHFASLESLRQGAKYNTGSISQSAQFALYSLSNFYQPTLIAEVGTFIGKSLVAMTAPAANWFAPMVQAYTCDYSNDIRIPLDSEDVKITRAVAVRQYPMKSSTAMFDGIVNSKVNQNYDRVLYNFDGRIDDKDIPLLKEINHHSNETIYALDDFEGIEKGVANYEKLKASSLLTKHWLVYPPSSLLLSKYGFRDYCSTALVIPNSMIVQAVQ